MKKEQWIEPELVVLGVEETKCDDGIVDEAEGARHPFKCPYCILRFSSQYRLDVHITKCHNTAVNLPLEGEEGLVPNS